MKKIELLISMIMIVGLLTTIPAFSQDIDVTVQITGNVLACRIEKNQKTGSTIIITQTELTNHSEEGIMEIIYQLTVFDQANQALDQITLIYNGQDTPISCGESVVDEQGWQQVLNGEADHVMLTSIETVLTEEELPPIHLPQPGEYLFEALNEEHLRNMIEEPPVSVNMWIDHMGARVVAEVTDEAIIAEVVERFMQIQIAAETQEFVTDNYNGVTMAFADGVEVSFSLNLKNLELGVYHGLRMYVLDEIDPFWNLMESMAQPEN